MRFGVSSQRGLSEAGPKGKVGHLRKLLVVISRSTRKYEGPRKFQGPKSKSQISRSNKNGGCQKPALRIRLDTPKKMLLVNSRSKKISSWVGEPDHLVILL